MDNFLRRNSPIETKYSKDFQAAEMYVIEMIEYFRKP